MIIGGTGQYGITLSQILIKKIKTYITSRSNKKIRLLKQKYPKIDFVKLHLQ